MSRYCRDNLEWGQMHAVSPPTPHIHVGGFPFILGRLFRAVRCIFQQQVQLPFKNNRRPSIKISLFVGHSLLDAAGERMRSALNPGSSLYSKKTDALGRLVSAIASVALLAVS